LKVRQPLKYVQVTSETDIAQSLDEVYQEIVKEELNVKEVMLGKGNAKRVTIDTAITPELKREGLMRELVRQIQTARKAAGLNVDDRIVLSVVSAEKDVLEAVEEHMDTIKSETLATSLNENELV